MSFKIISFHTFSPFCQTVTAPVKNSAHRWTKEYECCNISLHHRYSRRPLLIPPWGNFLLSCHSGHQRTQFKKNTVVNFADKPLLWPEQRSGCFIAGVPEGGRRLEFSLPAHVAPPATGQANASPRRHSIH